MLLERNHFPEYTQRDYSYLNFLWHQQEYNIYLLNHIIYKYPIGKTLQLISCIVFYFLQLSVSKYGVDNIDFIKFSDVIHEIHSNLSPIALENKVLNVTRLRDLAYYMLEFENTESDLPALEYADEADLSNLDYADLSSEIVNEIENTAENEYDLNENNDEDTIDFYNEESLSDYARALQNTELNETTPYAFDDFDYSENSESEVDNVDMGTINSIKERLFSIVPTEQTESQHNELTYPSDKYEDLELNVSPNRLNLEVECLLENPKELEAANLLKMIESKAQSSEIEPNETLEMIEALPEMQMIEENYQQPLEIEHEKREQIAYKPPQSMIQFPPEQTIALNQRGFESNEDPYVTFPQEQLDNEAYKVEMDLLERNPFVDLNPNVDMEFEQAAITYPEEAEMSEDLPLLQFKPPEMPNQIYLQSNPMLQERVQERLRILPSPRAKSKAVLLKRSKRIIARNNKNLPFNVQSLDENQLQDLDVVNIRKPLPIMPASTLKQIKDRNQRLAIENAKTTYENLALVKSNIETATATPQEILAIQQPKKELLAIENVQNINNLPLIRYNKNIVKRVKANKKLAIKNKPISSELAIIPRIKKRQTTVAIPKRRRLKQKYFVTFPEEQQSISNLIKRNKPRTGKRQKRTAITEGAEANMQLFEAEAARRWNNELSLLNVNRNEK